MGFFRRRRDEPVDPEERSPQLGVKFKDMLVLDQLMKAGADLQQPRHVLHFLYFAGEDPAALAASAARDAGWDAGVAPPIPEQPDQWLVRCEQHGIVTDPITVRDSTDFFEQLAATHGGEYDGWEASV